MLVGLILKKGMKSLQLMLNELMSVLETGTVSASAFSQARSHLCHTAFIELNQKAIVEVMYKNEDYEQFKNFRLLAIDGSKILLPNSKDTITAFGQIAYFHKNVQGKRTYAMASVLYDVLNKVAVDSVLAKAHAYEVDLAVNHHVPCTQPNDLIIADRGYASYRFLATLLAYKRAFVIRCSSGSFAVVKNLFTGEGKADRIETLQVPSNQRKAIAELKLPPTIQVRFVRLRLSTGEYEVLVTSLLDNAEFRIEDLAEIYRLRWEVENFYGIVKTRLTLENFTGKSAESVRQDFYATIYLAGLESILTADSNEVLVSKETRYPQQVNKAVSFNAIKNQVMDLLCSQESSAVLVQRLEQLFLTNPVSCRKKRIVPRQECSAGASLNHWKRKRKICY